MIKKIQFLDYFQAQIVTQQVKNKTHYEFQQINIRGKTIW